MQVYTLPVSLKYPKPLAFTTLHPTALSIAAVLPNQPAHIFAQQA